MVQVRNFASRDIEATHHSFTELSRIQVRCPASLLVFHLQSVV